MTVLSVNDAPVAVGVLPDQVLDEGGGPVTVDLNPFFDDVDGDTLTLRALSSDTAVATVMITGAILTLTPVSYGAASVTVMAEDPDGLTARQTFGVGVSDRLVRAVLGDTLAAMGRGHLASARMTLGRRVTAGAGEQSRLTVMGQSVPLGRRAAARTAVEQIAASWLPGSSAAPYAAPVGPFGFAAIPGAGFGPPGPRLSSMRPVVGVGRAPGGAVGMTDQALGGTNFLLTWSGDDPDEAGTGRRWTVWSQGDIQAFQGIPSTVSGYHGDVRTGYLGLDARLADRWLAGVALARSGGAGDWRVGRVRGRLTTTLTAMHPYLHWSDGATSVWTMVGGGSGRATNMREANGRVGGSALGLGLGLVEMRRRLGTVGGGAQLGLRGDAAWARLSTESGDETVDAQRAAVNQMRIGIEVLRPIRTPNGLSLTPFGKLNGRRDGGDGQTGVGLELAGGLQRPTAWCASKRRAGC